LAANVQIELRSFYQRKPDFFQLFPALNYTETTSATGEHTLRLLSLVSKEVFHSPVLVLHAHARTAFLSIISAGQATMTVRRERSKVGKDRGRKHRHFVATIF